MRVGWEFPNEERDLTAEEWAKVDALRSTFCKVRSYNLTAANIDGIRNRNLSVILRPDSDGDIDVPARVRELSAAAWRLRENGIGDITIIPDNEPNLGSKPVPPRYWNLFSEVIAGLYFRHHGARPLAATVRYANPPMAVGQNEEAWYEAGKDIIPAADYMTIHAYGQLNADLVNRAIALAKRYGEGLPILADEVGDSHGSAGWDTKAEATRVYLETLKQHGVTAACLFILGGTSDWANFHIPIDKLAMLADTAGTVEPRPPETPMLRDWTREEIIALIIAYSDAAGVPRRLTLACGIAESNLRQYATREGTWPDVSYGIGQQIVKFAPVGNGKDTPDNRALVRDWLFNPQNSIPLMVKKLAEAYDNRLKAGYSDEDAQWQALYRYNTGGWLPPGGQYVGNVENYRRAFVAADALLATREEELTPEKKAEIKVSLDKLWALASAFEQNRDQPNADYIKAEVNVIKQAAGL